MKLSLKKILEAGGMWGRFTNVDQAGSKVKYKKNPEEFPEVFDGPCRTKIKNNHGHILKVPMRDIHEKDEREYNIQGSSDHNHTVELDKSDFEALEKEKKIVVRSSEDDGHDHVVIIVCS